MQKIDGWTDPHRISNPYLAQRRLLRNKTAPLIFDVGAHKGESALAFREKFPEATIHSFEPTPESFAKLNANTIHDEKIKPWQLALSDRSTTIPFHCNLGSHTNSILGSCCAAAKLEKVIEVEATTLDLFCEKQSISQVDLLKIDTQGADLKVLHGAEKMLQRHAIQVVFTEVCIAPTYDEQGALDEIYTFLRKFQYRFCDLLCGAYTERGELKYCDLLFTSEVCS